jgi:hypothetical protein
VLAAALADNGRFDEARATAEQALVLARKSDTGNLAPLEGRLAMYREHKPFRQRGPRN